MKISNITRQLSFEDIKPKKKIRYMQILDRLIKEYKNLLAEREEDKKRIKELEVLEDDLKDKRIVYVDTAEFKENSIPKQKVINSINYYDERIKHAKLIKDKEQEEFYIDIKRAFYKLLEDK